jgi:catechol 2,3-dioxygenase-like lactoylglutathione lyase family enzyme
MKMKQRVAVITLPVTNLDIARKFYCEGLGWTSVFENPEVVFFQLNGMVLGLFLKPSFEKDIQAPSISNARGFALGHNVESRDEVEAAIAQARAAGAIILKEPAAPEWGGYSGYFSDPDGHVWEVAYNPVWKISPEGYTSFSS